MNKKQLLVAWIVGIWISLNVLISPYEKIHFGKIPIYKELTEEQQKNYLEEHPELNKFKSDRIDFRDLLIPPKIVGYKWGFETSKRKSSNIPFYLFYTLTPGIIIGGLVIYSLKSKKKQNI